MTSRRASSIACNATADAPDAGGCRRPWPDEGDRASGCGGSRSRSRGGTRGVADGPLPPRARRRGASGAESPSGVAAGSARRSSGRDRPAWAKLAVPERPVVRHAPTNGDRGHGGNLRGRCAEYRQVGVRCWIFRLTRAAGSTRSSRPGRPPREDPQRILRRLIGISDSPQTWQILVPQLGYTAVGASGHSPNLLLCRSRWDPAWAGPPHRVARSATVSAHIPR